ncbi:MAG: hemolysin, partial [Candidatus Zixiibacteriota bacterium]
MSTTIIIVVLTLISSAFFSGMEIAYVSANRLKAELDRKTHKLSAKIVSRLLHKPTGYIASMLIGNYISFVVYGLFMAILLNPVLVPWSGNSSILLILQTIISTLIILIFAEFFPKSFFISNPNTFLRIFAIPVYFFYIILFPIAQFTIAFSNLFLRIFGLRPHKEKQQLTFSKIDINYLVNEYAEEKEEEIQHELKIFQNALDFSEVKLRECMVPRTEIVALAEDTNINTLKQTFIETGFSKILIFRRDIDNIIGYVHSSDLFKFPKTIKDILHEVPIVPETKSAKELLAQLIKEHKSIAVV